MTSKKISKIGLDIIKEFEGFKSHAYIDPVGIPTIGYGTTRVNGQPVVLGMTCTENQAEMWLFEEVEHKCYKIIEKKVKVDINQNMFDALISFIYNVGTGNFSSSTLLRVLNKKDYKEASNQFNRWVFGNVRGVKKKLPGLVRRRKVESELFIKEHTKAENDYDDIEYRTQNFNFEID